MITVFSSTGCIRCRIVKNFLRTQHRDFVEYDIKTEEGHAAFTTFYRTHRASIRRDEEGIFFPVVQDGHTIVQDAGPSLARLLSGDRLDGIILPSNLGHGWTGGLRVLGYSPEIQRDFMTIVTLLKQGGLMTEMRTAGNNGYLLHELFCQHLVDRLIFEVRPSDADGAPVAEEAHAQSLNEVSAHPEVDIRLVIDLKHFMEGTQAPSPSFVGTLAEKIRHSLTNGTIPCTITNSADSAVNLLPYRTAVRRWLVRAEAA